MIVPFFEILDFFVYPGHTFFIRDIICKYLFQSVACYLIPFYSVFQKQKLKILMKSSLLIFSFMDCAFGIVSKKSSDKPRSQRFTCRNFCDYSFNFPFSLKFCLGEYSQIFLFILNFVIHFRDV